MKVFVYEKKTNKKVAVINGVTNAVTSQDKRIMLVSKTGEILEFCTRTFKVVLYQN